MVKTDAGWPEKLCTKKIFLPLFIYFKSKFSVVNLM